VGNEREEDEEVTETLREELFVEEDEGGLSLNSIAFAEKEGVRNRSDRNRKGLPEGLRGVGSVTALQRELTNGALVGKLFIEKTKLRRKESSSGGPLSIYSLSLVAQPN
jgi:hypothetical protein